MQLFFRSSKNMKQRIHTLLNLSYPTFFICIIILSVCSLLAAVIAEKLGFKPCIFCLYQRAPYALLILCSSAAIAFPKWQERAFKLTMLIVLSSIALSSYHSAIEMGIVTPPSACRTAIDYGAMSIEQIKNHVNQDQLGDCSKPALKILGISMAGWNLILNLCLFSFCYFLLKRKHHA